MKSNFTLKPALTLFILLFLTLAGLSQDCTNLSATAITTESTCMATGTITVNATGGSGNFNYQISGGSFNTLTSSKLITGLPSGNYTITVKDLHYNCTFDIENVVISGSYSEPRFSLIKTDLTCLNSNDGSISVVNLTGGLSPYTFTIISPSPSKIGTSNSTGVFTGLIPGEYVIKMQDSCGGLQTRRITILAFDWKIDTYAVTPNGCNDASASFSLSDNRGNTNTTGSAFSGYKYGIVNAPNDTTWHTSRNFTFNMGNTRQFTLVVKDACGNVKNISWTNGRIPSVGASVSTSSLNCSTFTAAVNNLVNLQNPQFCLFNSSNVQINCNTTGTFTSLPYGSYSVRVRDFCYDTTIVRNFTVNQAKPSVGSSVNITNRLCNTFNANITGQSNLSSPTYRLLNSSGNQIASNTNGSFNNLAYGNYCIQIVNGSCYDTTITRCFNVTRNPATLPSSPSVSARSCSTATINIAGSNLTNPDYELYDASNNKIASNNTGVFSNLAYGNYCVRMEEECTNTTITRCFTLSRLAPAVSSTVNQTNKTCSSFTASITGQSNLFNAQYRLYNSSNALIATNTNGVFNNLAYGSYCIRVEDPCYDTVISRCFTAAPNAVNMSLSAMPSCTLGTSTIIVNLSGGNSPYTIRVYNSSGTLVRTQNTSAATTYLDGFPGLGNNQSYRVEAESACGIKSSQNVLPIPSTFTKSITVNSKCPSGQWQNGASDLSINTGSNPVIITPKIIKKNGTATSISYNIVNNEVYKFVDMEPATYVVEYSTQYCPVKVYDTVTVAPYSFPNLQQSTAYQCDNNSFSLGASVNGGSAPFTYEIIGTYPGPASLQVAPQTNPVFNINDGNSYNLIRLRAVDNCGNATLNDVSILPLANIVVSASSNCYSNDVRLSVDSIPNANYAWYRKTSATDSTLVGTGIDYRISHLLPSDTGVYVCKTSVNMGCLTKISSYTLTGNCGSILSNRDRISYSTNRNTSSDLKVSVFPNPVKQDINLKIVSGKRQSLKISIYTITGQLVFERTENSIADGVLKINRGSAMKKGTYVIKIQNIVKGEIMSQRLILE
jgi:Secretion system C-terminal sorting domain/SprB repeat